MVADTEFPIINKLYIYGVLEFEFQTHPNGHNYNFTLSCEHIIIIEGRLIVGWEEDPFLGMAQIILRGSHASDELTLGGGLNVGAKAIGKYYIKRKNVWNFFIPSWVTFR